MPAANYWPATSNSYYPQQANYWPAYAYPSYGYAPSHAYNGNGYAGNGYAGNGYYGYSQGANYSTSTSYYPALGNGKSYYGAYPSYYGYSQPSGGYPYYWGQPASYQRGAGGR
jgi:hypothetical protein